MQKVMVEGKDFFDGDSKLATKNIPSNAVDKVQVLKNYAEIGQLSGVTNNQDNIQVNSEFFSPTHELKTGWSNRGGNHFFINTPSSGFLESRILSGLVLILSKLSFDKNFLLSLKNLDSIFL